MHYKSIAQDDFWSDDIDNLDFEYGTAKYATYRHIAQSKNLFQVTMDSHFHRYRCNHVYIYFVIEI